MPSFSERQTQAENLIRSQIESLENPAQTIPYWEVYRAITGTASNNGDGGGLTDIITGVINEDVRIIETPGIYNFNNYFYLYLKIINGLDSSVKLKSGENNDVPLSTNEYINFEPIPGRKHGILTLTIEEGGKVRIFGGF